MTDIQEKLDRIKALNRTRRIGRLILLLEVATAGLWRIVSWVAFFVGLWLLQVPSVFGDMGGAAALVVFIIGLILLAWHDVPTMRRPGADAVDRRLEQANALTHRPLSLLGDRLANPRKPDTYLLWQSNKTRALDVLRRLHLFWPRPFLTARDPSAFRILAALILFTGLIVAGPQAGDRIRAGLFPWRGTGGPQEKTQDVTLWITPPAYTGRQAIIVGDNADTDKPLAVPAGSLIKARIVGGIGHPALTMGTAHIPFKKMDDGNWGIETPVRPGSHFVVRQGFFQRASVPYNYIADKPPRITLHGKPHILKMGQWQFDVDVEDDYGVTDLTLHMQLAPHVAAPEIGAPVTIDRPIMTPGGQTIKLRPVYDMTGHTWAGLPVIVTLEARDHKGQTALSPPMHLHIPERPFHRPAAVKLIALRHDLAWDPENKVMSVATGLEDMLGNLKSYNGDISIFLSLRSASSHLIYDPTIAAATGVIPQLWDTALAIDEGHLPLAARTLRQAQENLQKLLNTPGTSSDQIADAMEKLRTALGNYLNEAFKNLQRNMTASGLPPLTPEQMNDILRPEDIAAFLDQLQARALAGDRKAARDMLAELQKITDSLDPSRGPSMPKDMRFMADALRKTQDLIKDQQALLTATKKNRDSANNAKSRKTQDGLIDRLETLMTKADDALGRIPGNLQNADKAMHRSAQALKADKTEQSLPAQRAAIAELQKGQNEMREQLRARLKQMMIAALGGGQIDPLGRVNDNGRMSGLFSGSPVKIPDRGQRREVQDIMQTLRQRSGDRSRPTYELDYYQRLMRQFQEP